RFHLMFEKAMAMTSVGLGAMQRDIRVLDKTVGALVAARSNRYPDACTYDEVMPLDPVWLVDGLDQTFREGSGLQRALAQDLNDAKFISPDTSYDIAMSDVGTQTVGDDTQHLVADSVS